MGWIEMHKEKGISYRDFFQEGLQGEIIDSCTKNGVFYGALRTERQEILALVILVRIQRGYYNFSYKWMDESYHPYYYECPDRILDLLTPTEDKCSNEWREICRKHNRTKRNVKMGDVIQFDKPFCFKYGRKEDLFVYKGRNLFKSVGNCIGMCRLKGWENYSFRKISNTTTEGEGV